MKRAAPITQAEIKRAVAAVLAAGVKVYGVKVDGSVVTVLTEPSEESQVGSKVKSRLLDADEEIRL